MSGNLALKTAIVRRGNEDLIDTVDRLPRAVRHLVHEFGASVVFEFVAAGIVDPNRIRHLIKAVHLGPREPGNLVNRGAFSTRRAFNIFDTWLVQHGAGFPAVALVRGMREMGFTPVGTTGPTKEMLAASMEAVTHKDERLTKADKHTRRLQAALKAADAALWAGVDPCS